MLSQLRYARRPTANTTWRPWCLVPLVLVLVGCHSIQGTRRQRSAATGDAGRERPLPADAPPVPGHLSLGGGGPLLLLAGGLHLQHEHDGAPFPSPVARDSDTNSAYRDYVPPGREGPRRKHAFTMRVGAAYWDDLHLLGSDSPLFSPDEFGRFEAWGPSFGFSFERYLVNLGPIELWLGADFGVTSFENEEDFTVEVFPSGEIEDGSVYATTLHFTPMATLVLPVTRFFEIYAGGGGGYYHLSLVESFLGYSDRLVSDDTGGGFAVGGLAFPIPDTPITLKIEDKVHFVRFDGLDRVIPGDDAVHGPINVIQFGLALEF